MRYTVEMVSGAMIHTKFHKDWFRNSKVHGGEGGMHRHRQHGALISLLLFLQNNESRLKTDTLRQYKHSCVLKMVIA
jgi:hypothetical protein